MGIHRHRMSSLFGFLATKFASSPENLATEALNYVLGRSRVAAGAFLRLLTEGGEALSDENVSEFSHLAPGRGAEALGAISLVLDDRLGHRGD